MRAWPGDYGQNHAGRSAVSGREIKEGSKVLGHIVEISPATNSTGARISLQFDKLVTSRQTISNTTTLSMAQVDLSRPAKTEVKSWEGRSMAVCSAKFGLRRAQSAETQSTGMTVPRRCGYSPRMPAEPTASNTLVSIAHAGRTDPIGVIVVASDSGKIKIPCGAGMLLRVTAVNHN
jgi:hypothetical protein